MTNDELKNALKFVRDAAEGLLALMAKSDTKTKDDSISILSTGLTIRTRNILARNGISTLDDLCDVSAEELVRFELFGVKCLKEVRENLKSHKLSLRGE